MGQSCTIETYTGPGPWIQVGAGWSAANPVTWSTTGLSPGLYNLEATASSLPAGPVQATSPFIEYTIR